MNVQTSPCVFRVVPATRPQPLQNCSLSLVASDSLRIECLEGFDGGLPQGFLLELVEVPSLRLLRNASLRVSVHSPDPETLPSLPRVETTPSAPRPQHPPVSFTLHEVHVDSSFRVLLFAVNAKGRSEPTVLDEMHVRRVAKFRGGAAPDQLEIELSPVLAALAVTVASLFVLSCCVLVALYRRSLRNPEK